MTTILTAAARYITRQLSDVRGRSAADRRTGLWGAPHGARGTRASVPSTPCGRRGTPVGRRPDPTDRAVEVRYVTTSRPRFVRASYGTRVGVEHGWAPPEADIVVVPGGGYARRENPGVWAEIRRGTLPRALVAAPRCGLTVAALCTGVMLLAAAGLTRGRPCTTHHKARPDLEREGGVLKNARVVDDGDLVTAGGITSGLELALWLVRRELGADAATGIEAMLEYEARGTVWTRTRI
ncbi:DJ-1/PfpI family protein [Streptomyces erythrochromogenes]|uniref:DJ-1/PfpI family protein n=1 Tax=Streptomyces erythrochromogenes TaxID=285574 RepID=UPI00367E1727